MTTNMITEPTLEELTAAKLAGLTILCPWCIRGRLAVNTIEDDTYLCPDCCGRGWIIHRPVDGGVRQ
jgi:uncharacterized protein (DUF983 family)